MIDYAAAEMAARLATPSTRALAAKEFAQFLNVDHIAVFVFDRAVNQHVPAPGFQQTLTDSARWRALFRNAAERTETETVGGRDPVVLTCGDVIVVLLGGSADRSRVEMMRHLFPLVAAALRAEHEAATAQGELVATRAHARQVDALATALDAARAEVEQNVRTLQQHARDLEDARSRAEESARAKDEFLAMLGHELRNPLSPIVTALHVMRLKQGPSREQEIIERQVAALMRLVDDLMDVARVTTGKVELRREFLDLGAAISRGIEMASPAFERKQQRLTVALPPDPMPVHADAARLAQVFANLLTNAAKYSDVAAEIVLTAERDGDLARVRVKDQGIGLSPDTRERVFDVFYQHARSLSRAEGGLGVGLAVVRSLVLMHGGKVTAHSDGEGRGSEFAVELPLASGRSATQPPEPKVGQRRAQQPGKRVLVVDDNHDAAAMLAEALTASGYVARTTHDGPSALDVASEFCPDVAILDIGLPVMDGYELAQRLRVSHPNTRLIAVTGYGQPHDQVRARTAGFDEHFVKPAPMAEIERAIADLVSR